MTVASVAADTQQLCASATPRNSVSFLLLVSSYQSDTRSMSCHCPSISHLANEVVAKRYERRDRHTRCRLSVADEHNSDKQSHDVCVNCNTQILQLNFISIITGGDRVARRDAGGVRGKDERICTRSSRSRFYQRQPGRRRPS